MNAKENIEIFKYYFLKSWSLCKMKVHLSIHYY